MIQQEILSVCECCMTAAIMPEPHDYFEYHNMNDQRFHEQRMKELAEEIAQGLRCNWAESTTLKDEFSISSCDSCGNHCGHGARYEVYLLLDDKGEDRS